MLKNLTSKGMLKIIIPFLVLLAGISISWAIVVQRPSLKTEVPASQVPLVQAVQVEPQTVKLNIHSQGVVVPRTEIDLVPEVAGQIFYIHPSLVAGGFFEAGDILLTIDPRDYDYAISEALARIAEAQRQVTMEEAQAEQARNEWQVLGEGEPTPLTMREPQLAEARAKFKAAQADLAHARLQRSRCEWRVMFSGRVRNMRIGLGQYVQSGEKLARLYATDVAQVRLPLTTDQVAYFDLLLNDQHTDPATAAKVTLSAMFAGSVRHWEGRVIRTEGALDEETGLLHAVAEVRNPYSGNTGSPPLMPGLFVKAEIEGRELHDIFILPPNSVNTAQEALLIDGNNKLRIKRLDILRSDADRIIVRDGLKRGNRVVISHVDFPIEGMSVRTEMVPLEQGAAHVILDARRGTSHHEITSLARN